MSRPDLDQDHTCAAAGCTAFGPFGTGHFKGKAGRWWCRVHRPVATQEVAAQEVAAPCGRDARAPGPTRGRDARAPSKGTGNQGRLF